MKLAFLALVIGTLEPLDAERPARAPVELTFALYSSTPAAIDASAAAKTRIDAVWIGLQDARLRPTAACQGTDTRAIVAGSFTVELVKRNATKETKLEVGRYCAFEVQLLRRTRGPGELKGASIVIEGRRGDGMPFTLRSRADLALRLRAVDLEGFQVSDGGARWIVGVDIARWMQRIDIEDETVDRPRDRKLVIDETSNPDLIAKFDANVGHGLALFEDLDGDRSLDAEERARPIAVSR